MTKASELRRFVPDTGPLSDAHYAMLEGADEIESLTEERDRLAKEHRALTEALTNLVAHTVIGDTVIGDNDTSLKAAGKMLQAQELARLARKGIHFDG